MGHFVTGLIGHHSTLTRFAQQRSLHLPIALPQGLTFLPLRDVDIDSFLPPPLTNIPEGFLYLSKQLLEELFAGSEEGAIMYFETEYFGGGGTQGAVVVRDRELVFGPTRGEIGPINEALSWFNVRVIPPARDAFESIGLDRHRHTIDWMKLDDDLGA